MSAPTGFHSPIDIDAPVSLSAYRARRQKPYPAVCGHLPETDERDTQPRPPVAAVGTAFVALLLLIALVAWLARFFLKG